MADSDTAISGLQRFLVRRLPSVTDIEVRDYQILTGGYSHPMAKFTAVLDGKPHQLVARGELPPGHAPVDTDRTREWLLLSALTKHGGIPIAPVRFYDHDGSELGSKTIVSDFVDGQPFLSLLRETTAEAGRRTLADALCDLVTAIHSLPLDALPECVERPADWHSYIDSCIEAWCEAEMSHVESVPVLRYIGAWLGRNRPPEAPLTFVHGEFQSANIIAKRDGTLVAVDWEMSRIGDPREDLGYYKQVATVQEPDAIGWDDARFCKEYCKRTGLSDDVINPATIAYFTILPLGRSMGLVLDQLRNVIASRTTNVMVPYNMGVFLTWSDAWLKQTHRIESVTRGAA